LEIKDNIEKKRKYVCICDHKAAREWTRSSVTQQSVKWSMFVLWKVWPPWLPYI